MKLELRHLDEAKIKIEAFGAKKKAWGAAQKASLQARKQEALAFMEMETAKDDLYEYLESVGGKNE